MKRTIARLSIILLVLVLGIAGLAWARPDLLAALNRLRVNEVAENAGDAVAPEAAPELPPAPLVDDGWCSTHHRPEAGCTECKDVAGSAERSCLRKLPVVTLSGPDIPREIGLSITDVGVRQLAETLYGNAEVVYNANTYAEVRPRVRGLVHEIDTDEGYLQKAGDVLAVMDSSEVGSFKAQYLAILPQVKLAEVTLERTSALTKKNALPLKAELEARTALARAQADLLNAAQQLRNLGFTQADLDRIEAQHDTSSLLRVVAPIEGTVVSRHAVQGEAVDANHPLFFVADTRVMWAWIDVYENEIDRVKPGQTVVLTITGLHDASFQGRVDWIDTEVNPATRTIRVRAEIQNPEGKLRSLQFGRAAIQVGEPREVTVVPRAAVQNDGMDNLVFLPAGNLSYRPQRVQIEPVEEPGMVRVVWGLKPGEPIVVDGSFPLLTEMLNLEAGR